MQEKNVQIFCYIKFLPLVNQSDNPKIKSPYQVARYLAAIVVAEAEMVSLGEAEAGLEFFENLQDLADFINHLQSNHK